MMKLPTKDRYLELIAKLDPSYIEKLRSAHELMMDKYLARARKHRHCIDLINEAMIEYNKIKLQEELNCLI